MSILKNSPVKEALAVKEGPGNDILGVLSFKDTWKFKAKTIFECKKMDDGHIV